MVVEHTIFRLRDETFFIARFCRGVPDLTSQRRVGVSLLIDVQVRVADHVEEDERVGMPPNRVGEGARTEKPIPAFDVAAVFRVKEDEADAALLRREDARHFEQYRHAGRAVVCAGHPDEAFRGVGVFIRVEAAVVMRAEEDARRRLAAMRVDVVDFVSQYFGWEFLDLPAGGFEFVPNPRADFRVRGGPRRSRSHAALRRDILPRAFAVETGGRRRRSLTRDSAAEETPRGEEENAEEEDEAPSMDFLKHRRGRSPALAARGARRLRLVRVCRVFSSPAFPAEGECRSWLSWAEIR